MNRLTASILVLLGAASYGMLSTIVKLGYQAGFTPAEITGSQVLLGCIGLWLICLPSIRQLRPLSKQTIIKLILSGTFAGLTGVFYYLALQTISASLGVILLFQFVWMGILFDWILERRRPGNNQWIALVFVLIGTVLAAGTQALIAPKISVWGIIFGLLAAATYTGTLSVNARVATEVPPIIRGSLMTTGTMLITLLIYPPQFFFNGSLVHGLWFWALLLGLFGVLIPSYCYAKGIPAIGSGMATILGSAELPVVVITSALILKEPVELTQWLGIILILFGIVCTQQSIRWKKLFVKPAH
ncbi:MAG TPA: DMT family transporter [Ktedonobacteraceae bacterium]|nr:DMT family transporter [Ktedonobacteraceae bacterium]